MAKNEVDVKVRISDDGTLALTEKSAKKLGVGLDKAGVSAQTADRQLKGAAKTSSNSTKNFSKMAQGISGGLVPAYATLAAQIFAVSAAFQFLNEAASYRNLVEGQQQYGAVTGIAFGTITKALQDATEGQLKYKEAAQATAIGTAAGLSKDQLTGLAAAAKNTSLALGRDLTDSFNRLIRGVTKAEPELLDELGIILRLDPALNDYAGSIGKTKEELNAFERSQAVANFVLDEAESKFGKMAKIMDEDAYVVQQFAKSFDDLVNTIKVGVIKGISPILKFLSDNTLALTAALGLAALPIVKSIIPAFDDMAKGAQSAAKEALKNVAKQKREIKKLGDAYEEAADAGVAAGKKLEKSKVLTGEPVGKHSGAAFMAGKSDSKAARRNAERIADSASKAILAGKKYESKGLKIENEKQLADYKKSLKLRQIAADQSNRGIRAYYAQTSLFVKKTAAEANLVWKNAMASTANFASKAAGKIDKAFKAMGYIGIALMIFDLGKAAIEALFPMSEAQKEVAETAQAMNERLAETVKHLKAVNEARNELGLMSLNETMIQTGNAVSEANIPKLAKDLEFLTNEANKNTEAFKEVRKNFNETVNQLSFLDTGYKVLHKALYENRVLTEEEIKNVTLLTNAYIEQKNNLGALTLAQKDVANETNRILNSIGKLPLEDYLRAITKERDLSIAIAADTTVFDAKMTELLNDLANVDRDFPVSTTTTRSTKRGTRTTTVEDPNAKAKRKARKEALQADIDAFKLQKKRNEEDAETAKRIVTKIAPMQTKILSIEKDRVENSKEAVMIDQFSMDTSSKIARLRGAELNQKNNILKKDQEIAEAEALRIVAVEKKDELAIARADKLLDILRGQKEIEEKKLDNIEKGNEIKTRAINLEETLLRHQKDINTSKLKELQIQREINRLQSGLGTPAFTAGQDLGAIAREQRRVQLESLQEQRTRASAEASRLGQEFNAMQFRPSSGRQGRRDEIDPADYERAKFDRDMAEEKVQNLDLEIEKNQKLEEIIVSRMGTNNKELELKLLSLQYGEEEILIQQRLNEARLAGGDMEDPKFIEQVKTRAKEEHKLTKQLEFQTKIADTLKGSMESAFMGIIDGSMNAAEAFDQMGKRIMAMIAQMVVEFLVMKAVSGFMGMMFGGPALSPHTVGDTGAIASGVPQAHTQVDMSKLGGRYGGVFSNGRKLQTGGIATGPNSGYMAELHGTEAVVPLPGNGKIPVNLVGRVTVPTPVVQLDTAGLTGAFSSALQQNALHSQAPEPVQHGGTNNVTVNVDAAGAATTDTGQPQGLNQEQTSMLGKAVSMAVQNELHKQKRPGGILSPMGIA